MSKSNRETSKCAVPDVEVAPKANPRTPRAVVPLSLSLSLLLAACSGSGLELTDIAETPADTHSAQLSSPIETGALGPIERPAAAKAPAEVADSRHGADIAKARMLRQNGDLKSAMHALQAASAKAPDDKALLKERGLLALELGQIADAKTLLGKADDPASPDWRIKSALGSAHAASGDQAAAQREFSAALKLAPDHPSILNNLALSYALDGRRKEAEELLRRAAKSPDRAAKAKQNLALLLGLDGRIEEAREVSESALPKEMASANISYLEKLKAGPRVSRSERRTDEGDTSQTTIGALTPNN